MLQTFLPFSDFTSSAIVLSTKHLKKQCSDTKKILKELLADTPTELHDDPAVLMWKGYEEALAIYGAKMCIEWNSRVDSPNNNLLEYFLQRIGSNITYPRWIGSESFHRSHRSNLLRLDPIHYSKFKWNIESDYQYEWPVRVGK